LFQTIFALQKYFMEGNRYNLELRCAPNHWTDMAEILFKYSGKLDPLVNYVLSWHFAEYHLWIWRIKLDTQKWWHNYCLVKFYCTSSNS